MKRRVWRRAAAVLLVMSMQAAPLSYAAEPGDEVPGNNTDITEDITIIEEDPNTVDDIDENNSGITQDINTENTGSATEDGISEGEGLEIEAPNDTDASVSEGVPGDMGTPGWLPQGSDWYYYDASGAKAYGWRAIDGVWYYLDGSDPEKPGVMVANTKREIDGAMYFFSPSGAMRTGWIQEGTDWYYAGGNGAMLTGWQWIGGAWYYLDGSDPENPGVMLADTKQVINGATYFFWPSGAMRTGWIREGNEWYYADNTSSVGWKYVNGAWYYLDGSDPENPGVMLADCKQGIGGLIYFFNASGAMQTGWVQRPEGWYYASGNGSMYVGWVQTNGKWYYLDKDNQTYPGLMVKSTEMTIGDLTYYFEETGAMRAGWVQESDGSWYYYDTYTGQIKSGWQYIGGAWYYLDPENGNKMLTEGWHTIGGSRYYMYGSGAMATNWLLLGNDWYYLGGDGAMKTGWQFVNGRWYYMYTGNDGYGQPEGVMAKDTIIDGYELSSSGAMYTAAEIAARNVLNSIGWDLRAAFNWSAGLTYYRMTADPSPGSEWFANYGFQNGRGNCYVMAATFCYMARMLGYDAHQMAGLCPTISGGMNPHSWCEVVIGGTTYVFDPNFTNETGRNGYQISYGTSGTWVYTSYYRMN